MNRINPTFVDPSTLAASSLKAVVCLYLYGRPAPFVSGHAFCFGIKHQSISAADTFINWKTIGILKELKLVYVDEHTEKCKDNPEKVQVIRNVNLTSAGRGMAKSFKNKPILGYD